MGTPKEVCLYDVADAYAYLINNRPDHWQVESLSRGYTVTEDDGTQIGRAYPLTVNLMVRYVEDWGRKQGGPRVSHRLAPQITDLAEKAYARDAGYLARAMNMLPRGWRVEPEESNRERVFDTANNRRERRPPDPTFSVHRKVGGEQVTGSGLSIHSVSALFHNHWRERFAAVATKGMSVEIKDSGCLLRDAGGNSIGRPMTPGDALYLLEIISGSKNP